MVTKHLENLTSGDSEFARSLSKEIQGLEIKSLRKIKNKTAIETICNEVIRAVDDLLLVYIDETELRNRKIKKQKFTPIVHTDDDRWSQSAIIRSDWNSERWIKNPPHGWVYYDSNSSILGVIYETGERNSGNYSSFLKKEVADNPIGAILLLKEMKDRLNKITHKK